MSAGRKLKIGLDFHGVITDNPEYFKAFSELAVKEGHEIHVISGGPKETITQFLNRWGIKYSDIFAIVDYYDAKGCVTFFENGEFKVDEKLWNCAKAAYCEENHIDIHIDDTIRYSEGFKTPFCFYDVRTRHCSIRDKKIINLSASPKVALKEIVDFVTNHWREN